MQNEQKKQNESREFLFNETINNNNNEESNNKKILSKNNLMSILNNNAINKRSASVINKRKTLSNSLIQIHKKNKNTDLANTQRENKKILENIEDKK